MLSAFHVLLKAVCSLAFIERYSVITFPVSGRHSYCLASFHEQEELYQEKCHNSKYCRDTKSSTLALVELKLQNIPIP